MVRHLPWRPRLGPPQQVLTWLSFCLPVPGLWPINSPQEASVQASGGQVASSGQQASLGTLLCPGSWGEGLGWCSKRVGELHLASSVQWGFDMGKSGKGEQEEENISKKTNFCP